MEQRDYLKDQIDSLARALGKVIFEALKLRSKGLPEESLMKIEQGIETTLALKMEDLESAEEDELIILLQKREPFVPQHYITIGSLLEEAGLASKDTGNTERAGNLLRKALKCYQTGMKEQREYSFDLHGKISQINELLTEM